MEGSLTVDNRFQRIEETLMRIEVKLDSKASLVDMERLEARVTALENGTSPYISQMLSSLRSAQEEVSRLQLKVTTNLAVEDAVNTSKGNSRQLKIVVIGMIITAIGTIGGLIVSIASLLNK